MPTPRQRRQCLRRKNLVSKSSIARSGHHRKGREQCCRYGGGLECDEMELRKRSSCLHYGFVAAVGYLTTAATKFCADQRRCASLTHLPRSLHRSKFRRPSPDPVDGSASTLPFFFSLDLLPHTARGLGVASAFSRVKMLQRSGRSRLQSDSPFLRANG